MKPASEPRCPYQGLIPYDENDADFFFGREQETQLITANLFASSLTLLYGASGVGKSSILRAGVTHSLRQRDDLLVVVFSTWQSNPLDDLKAAVDKAAAARGARNDGDPEAATVPDTSSTRAEPEQVENLLGFLTGKCSKLNCSLLIILDQFEEYFLYHPQGDAFETEFAQTVSTSEAPISFLISIREDSLAKLDRFEKGIPAIFDNYLRLEHLDRSAAEAAIIMPLNHYNAMRSGAKKVDIEPQLIDRVLDQVKTGELQLGEAGLGGKNLSDAEVRIETPFLQMVMMRLWNKEMEEGSNVLRLQTLEGLGNAARIIRTHLDDAMSTLTQDEQEIVAKIFRHLVTPSGSKIAHSSHDLFYFTGLPQRQIVPVLNKLSSGNARILQPVAPPANPKAPPHYEIYHDVLAAAILDWRRRFQQAQEWTRHGEQRELEQRRTVLRRIGFVVILLLIGAFIVSLYRNFTSAEREKRALSREVAAVASKNVSKDPELSFRLAFEAVNLMPTEEAIKSLREALAEYPPLTVVTTQFEVRHVSFSPDGRYLLTAGLGPTASLWDTTTGNTLTFVGGGGPVTTAIFSPDGTLIALATNPSDPTVRIFDAHSADTYLAEINPEGKQNIKKVVFSPDSRLVATISDDNPGVAHIWDARTGQKTTSPLIHAEGLNDITFSPDGRFIATACYDGNVYIWETNTGQQKQLINTGTYTVNDVSFSPDGKSIIAATFNPAPGASQLARVYDLDGGNKFDLTHANAVYAASFSSDGKYILSVDSDRTIYLWDLNTREAKKIYGSPRSYPIFSPDAQLIAAGATEQAYVWDLTGKEYKQFPPPPQEDPAPKDPALKDDVYAVAFSPNSLRLATATEDGKARIWRLRKSHASFQVEPRKLSFSADGRFILSGNRMWDFVTGEPLPDISTSSELSSFSPMGTRALIVNNDRSTQQVSAGIVDAQTRKVLSELRPLTAYIKSAAFSADGNSLITLSEDDLVRIWDVNTGGTVVEFKDDSDARSAAFSPDGSYVVIGNGKGNVRTWDVRNKKLVRDLAGLSTAVTNVAYSPDGKLIAGSDSLAMIIWDAQTGERKAELPEGFGSFSPDGRLLLTLDGGEAHVRAWPLSENVPPVILESLFFVSAIFSPDGMFIVTTTSSGTANVFPREAFLPEQELIRAAKELSPRPLSCEEKTKYLHSPCLQVGPLVLGGF